MPMTRSLIAKLIAGVAVAGSAVWPTSSTAQCNSYCGVGAYGQGGVSSDGNARGFRIVAPGQTNPDIVITNVGNPDAGHIDVTLDGETLGTLDGTYHDGVCIGRATGGFGDYRGRDPNC